MFVRGVGFNKFVCGYKAGTCYSAKIFYRKNVLFWFLPLITFAKMEHWMASHCVSMSIMVNPPISIGSIMVFLFTLTFLWFQRKSYVSFLMFWIMSAGPFSTYAGYQILFSMTWFINIFCRALKRKFHSILSNTFSWSSAIIAAWILFVFA